MSDVIGVVHSHMRALVVRYGCFDAVCEALAARHGHSVSKGTISKKMAGDMPWSVSDAVALEDALGAFPVTDALKRRVLPGCAVRKGSLIEHTSTAARETGEALAALMAAQESDQAGDRATAIKEIDEAVEALRSARARLEADRELS